MTACLFEHVQSIYSCLWVSQARGEYDGISCFANGNPACKRLLLFNDTLCILRDRAQDSHQPGSSAAHVQVREAENTAFAPNNLLWDAGQWSGRRAPPRIWCLSRCFGYWKPLTPGSGQLSTQPYAIAA